jgi:hypothetical protein
MQVACLSPRELKLLGHHGGCRPFACPSSCPLCLLMMGSKASRRRVASVLHANYMAERSRSTTPSCTLTSRGPLCARVHPLDTRSLDTNASITVDESSAPHRLRVPLPPSMSWPVSGVFFFSFSSFPRPPSFFSSRQAVASGDRRPHERRGLPMVVADQIELQRQALQHHWCPTLWCFR